MSLATGLQSRLGGSCISNMYSRGLSVVENDGTFTFCQDTRTVSGSMSTMVGLLIGTPGKSEWEKEHASKMVEK